MAAAEASGMTVAQLKAALQEQGADVGGLRLKKDFVAKYVEVMGGEEGKEKEDRKKKRRKLSKSERRRRKKQLLREAEEENRLAQARTLAQRGLLVPTGAAVPAPLRPPPPPPGQSTQPVYVEEEVHLGGAFKALEGVFEAVRKREERQAAGGDGDGSGGASDGGRGGGDDDHDRRSGGDRDDQEEDGEEGPDEREGGGRLSRRKQRRMSRMSVAALKRVVARPDLVEVHDANAPDPRTLLFLKAQRHTVHVPRHWNQRRKYLQGKRGSEKAPYKLPQFIVDTGIAAMRDAQTADEEAKSTKQKMRARMQPKMGRIDIDYEALYDAFFRNQEKPDVLTGHGDLYYEGKEEELIEAFKRKRPGQLSRRLVKALGMREGDPPPWLFNMQRFGPPPSYPWLKVPGVNCPIPAGRSFGQGPGQWGTPPVVDASSGRSVWGGEDLFASVPPPSAAATASALGDGERWGHIEEDLDDDEEDDEEEEDDDDDEYFGGGGEDDDDGRVDGKFVLRPAADGEGVQLVHKQDDDEEDEDDYEEDDEEPVQLRKHRQPQQQSGGPPPEEEEKRQLYEVLELETTNVGEGGLFGSSHSYKLPSEKTKKRKRDDDDE